MGAMRLVPRCSAETNKQRAAQAHPVGSPSKLITFRPVSNQIFTAFHPFRTEASNILKRSEVKANSARSTHLNLRGYKELLFQI
jgi:hypothetical protein